MDKTILKGKFQTIDWLGDEIIDWGNAGTSYSLKGNVRQLHKYHIGFTFDRAISSADGVYAFIFQRLGTKGLLLKNGEILREVNRSYYCANVYEYPATFLSFQSKTYLVHCPISYCQLDFENVETGELVTNIKKRDPFDLFHSRLEVSPNNKYLMSKGWVWHPIDVILTYEIEVCVSNPQELDKPAFEVSDVGVEICTASFLSDQTAVIGSSDEILSHNKLSVLPSKSYTVWDFVNNSFGKAVTPAFEFGNLVAINERFAWDTFKYPKIIDLATGDVVDKDEAVFSGEQNTAIHTGVQPQISFNRSKDKLAILNGEDVVVLSHRI